MTPRLRRCLYAVCQDYTRRDRGAPKTEAGGGGGGGGRAALVVAVKDVVAERLPAASVASIPSV